MDDGQNEFCAKKGAEGETAWDGSRINWASSCVQCTVTNGERNGLPEYIAFRQAERSLDAGWRLICAQIAVIMFPKKVVQAESG